MEAPASLYDETVELLRQRRMKFREIATDTGLNYDWLHKLSQGAIRDPGVRKIEKLHRYLTSSDQAA